MQNLKLTETDKKIIKSRLKGESFSELSEADLRLATDKILLRGAAIYGCPLPSTEGFAKILSDEISIFINSFGYGELTLSEIVLAMYLNAWGQCRYLSNEQVERIEFSGACFHVSFLAQILANYKTLRNQLDRKFQNQIDGYQ